MKDTVADEKDEVEDLYSLDNWGRGRGERPLIY